MDPTPLAEGTPADCLDPTLTGSAPGADPTPLVEPMLAVAETLAVVESPAVVWANPEELGREGVPKAGSRRATTVAFGGASRSV